MVLFNTIIMRGIGLLILISSITFILKVSETASRSGNKKVKLIAWILGLAGAIWGIVEFRIIPNLFGMAIANYIVPVLVLIAGGLFIYGLYLVFKLIQEMARDD